MVICACRATTEHELADAVDQGATTLSDVMSACGIGMDCGCCRHLIKKTLDRELAKRVNSAVNIREVNAEPVVG